MILFKYEEDGMHMTLVGNQEMLRQWNEAMDFAIKDAIDKGLIIITGTAGEFDKECPEFHKPLS